jgi:hypothetical protein
MKYTTESEHKLTRSIAGYTGERAKRPDYPDETFISEPDASTPVGVVGATVGGVAALALLFGGFFLVKRRTRRRNQARQEHRVMPGEHEETWALAETSQHKLSLRDTSQCPVHEVDGNTRVAELSSQSPTRAELPAYK